MKDIGVSKFVYVIIGITTVFILFGCDSYNARKKLVSELSLLFTENRMEFDKIQAYFLRDSIGRSLSIDFKSDSIEIWDQGNKVDISKMEHLSNDTTLYQIFILMHKEKINRITGNNKEGWITLSFEDFKYPCFNFWYKCRFRRYPASVSVIPRHLSGFPTTGKD